MPVRRQGEGERSRDAQRGEDAAQPHDHVGGWLDAVGRPHQHVERAKPVLLETKCLAYAALDAVALARPCGMATRHQQPEARSARITAFQVESVASHFFLPAIAQQAFELRFLREPPASAEPEALVARG